MSREMQRPAAHLMDGCSQKIQVPVPLEGFATVPAVFWGVGTSVLVTGDPWFAGSARAGAPLGTVMSPLTWLCCSDCCLEGQLFKPEPCDLNRRDFSWIPGWLEEGGWEQVNILPL